MQIKISEIQVKKRIRHDMGDITDLAQSMNDHGLMNPIVLTERKVLIAGHRRLEAAKKLGWRIIEARIMPDLNKTERLEMEIDENLYRKDFTSDEIVEAFHNLEKLKNPGFFRKFLLFIKKLISYILRR